MIGLDLTLTASPPRCSRAYPRGGRRGKGLQQIAHGSVAELGPEEHHRAGPDRAGGLRQQLPRRAHPGRAGRQAMVLESCHLGKLKEAHANNDKISAVRIGKAYLAGTAKRSGSPTRRPRNGEIGSTPIEGRQTHHADASAAALLPERQWGAPGKPGTA